MNEETQLQQRAIEALNLEEALNVQLAAVKEMQERVQAYWDDIEQTMITHDIKQIKGEFGTLTIAERLKWQTSDELPSKFYKKVVDTKKLTDTYRLEGKEIKGASHSTTKYLTKRLKSGQNVKEVIEG